MGFKQRAAEAPAPNKGASGMIPGQPRAIAILGFGYVIKIIAAAVLILALGESANAIDMWLQSRSGK
jgi:hypothetical protein